MKSITAVLALVGITNAILPDPEVGPEYFYAADGQERWKEATEYINCGVKGGSPISLSTDFGTYDSYSYLKDIKYDNNNDSMTKFTNQKNVDIKWTGASTLVELDNGPNVFKSDIGETVFGAHTTGWEAQKYTFRSPAEHQISGKNHDLEMQTMFIGVPSAQTDIFKGAAIGIMFSVNDFNVKLSKAEQLIIDTFFETLDWAKINNPNVNLNTYGDLMNMVDMKNRWAFIVQKY